MHLDPHRIIRRPIVTEKGMAVKETQQTVVFEVAASANKVQIKDAVRLMNVAEDGKLRMHLDDSFCQRR